MSKSDYVLINRKKIPLMKYLSEEEAIVAMKNMPIFQFEKKGSIFGMNFRYYYVGQFNSSARKGKSKVFICRNKIGKWLSFLHGYANYLDSIEANTHPLLWFEDKAKWDKIVEESSL
jgi:hypothetical protein